MTKADIGYDSYTQYQYGVSLEIDVKVKEKGSGEQAFFSIILLATCSLNNMLAFQTEYAKIPLNIMVNSNLVIVMEHACQYSRHEI